MSAWLRTAARRTWTGHVVPVPITEEGAHGIRGVAVRWPDSEWIGATVREIKAGSDRGWAWEVWSSGLRENVSGTTKTETGARRAAERAAEKLIATRRERFKPPAKESSP